MHILFSFVCMCMQVHMCLYVNEGTHTHSMCVDGQRPIWLSVVSPNPV